MITEYVVYTGAGYRVEAFDSFDTAFAHVEENMARDKCDYEEIPDNRGGFRTWEIWPRGCYEGDDAPYKIVEVVK